MTEHRIELHMKPPTALARLWYRRLGQTPPISEAHSGPAHRDAARLVTYSNRGFHRAYAATFGYFWLPCPLCDEPFGGHESAATIPDPTRPPSGGLSICSQCTIERNRDAR